MNDIDLELQTDLDRWYPPVAGAPDWAAVLARAGSTRPRRRRPLLIGVGAALTIAVALVFAVSLSRNGVGFGQKALAAIGSGRYLDAELRPITSPASTIDLATGRVAPIAVRWRVVYDTRTGAASGRTTFAGVVFGGTGAADPFVRDFAGGYQRALASGGARLLREPGVVDGVRARVIRFATISPTASRNARTSPSPTVDAQAHSRSLRVGRRARPRHDASGPRSRSCGSHRQTSCRRSRSQSPASSTVSTLPSITGNASDIRDVSIGEASDALGHRRDLAWGDTSAASS